MSSESGPNEFSAFDWKNYAQIYGPALLYSVGLGAATPAVASAGLSLGMGIPFAAALVMLIGIGSMIANAPAAIFTNRFGERLTIILSAKLGAGGSVISWGALERWVPLSENVQIVLYVLGVLLIGAAGGGFNLARQSYLTAAVPVDLRARAMSILGGTLRIGIFVGPFIGAPLQFAIGIEGAFVASAACMGIAGVASYWIRELETPSAVSNSTSSAGDMVSSPPAPSTFYSLAKRHHHLLVTIGVGVVGVSAIRAARQAIIPLWADQIGMSPAEASLVYGVSGLFDLLVFYPAGAWMDRKGRRNVAVTCMGIMGISLILLAFTVEPVSFYLVSALLGLGNGFGSGIVMTLGADFAPPDARTSFLALWRTFSDFGAVAGPGVLSSVSALAGLTTSVLASAFLSLLAAAIFAYYLPKGPGPAYEVRI